MTATNLTRLKVLTSHAAHARFLAECSEEPIGHIVRRPDIDSPYAYSPTKPVYAWGEAEILVAIFETSHRRYEVYEIPSNLVYATQAAAEARFMVASRTAAGTGRHWADYEPDQGPGACWADSQGPAGDGIV